MLSALVATEDGLFLVRSPVSSLWADWRGVPVVSQLCRLQGDECCSYGLSE